MPRWPPISAAHGLEFCHTKHADRRARPDGSRLISAWTGTPTSRPSTLVAGDGAQYAADVGEIETNAGLLFGLLGGGLWTYPTSSCLPAKHCEGDRAASPLPRRCADPGPRLAGELLPVRARRARSGRPGCCMPGWSRGRVIRPDRQGHRLRAGGAGAPVVKGGAKNLLAAFEALTRECVRYSLRMQAVRSSAAPGPTCTRLSRQCFAASTMPNMRRWSQRCRRC